MCYLIAKKFGERGCIAIQEKHGIDLANFSGHLDMLVKGKDIQIVVISRPSAYGEYEPYTILPNRSEFEQRVLKM